MASHYLVHNAVFSTGERMPVILHRYTLAPATLPNWYLLARRRDTRSASTLLRDASVLRWLYEWAAERRLDLDDRVRLGTLTADEITALSRYLRLRRNSSVVGAIYGPDPSYADEPVEILSNKTLGDYLGVTRDFLIWAVATFAPANVQDADVRAHILEGQDRIARAFGSVPRTSPARRGRGLTDNELEELLDVVRPDSDRNPFRPSNRLRNQLILWCLLLFGMRRGELLKLTIDDLPLGPEETVLIANATDDPDDPRRREPRQKTLRRAVYCDRWLAVELHAYATRRRGKTKYLFTNNRGSPIDYGGIHAIFVSLGRALPGLKATGRLHPHALRHTSAELFRRFGRQSKYGEREVDEAMRNQFGWSARSEMPAHYGQSEIDAARQEILMAFQQRFRG